MKKLLALTFAIVALVGVSGLGVAQEERKRTKGSADVETAKIDKACNSRKAGDVVKVDGKDVTCQTPAPEVAQVCKNKKAGDTVRIAGGKNVQCPPACCYINGCVYPQNRECL